MKFINRIHANTELRCQWASPLNLIYSKLTNDTYENMNIANISNLLIF